MPAPEAPALRLASAVLNPKLKSVARSLPSAIWNFVVPAVPPERKTGPEPSRRTPARAMDGIAQNTFFEPPLKFTSAFALLEEWTVVRVNTLPALIDPLPISHWVPPTIQ